MITRRFTCKTLGHLFSKGRRYFHCGPGKQNLRLLNLLENRLLQLSDDILMSGRSSITDQIAAIKGETRALRSRGFKVPTKIVEKENEDFRLLIDDIAHSSAADASGLSDRVKLYRLWAEREERNEIKDIARLERICDRRFYVINVSFTPLNVPAYQ